MTSSATLIAEGIHKSFGDLNVLKGISLEAYQGDVISILGSSGSGKRTVNSLQRPVLSRRLRGIWTRTKDWNWVFVV